MKIIKNSPDSMFQKASMLFALLLVFCFSLSTVRAQNDSMYIMKQGNILEKYKISEVDSIIFYQLQTAANTTFIDSRDNRTYKTVKIGNQVWMAENLAYLPSVVGPGTGSETSPYYYVIGYDGMVVADAKTTTNYITYGVLYNWPAAMNGATSSSTSPSGVQGICPAGWHLPSDAEWSAIVNYLISNGYNYDGTTSGNKIAIALATATGWNSYTDIGTVGNTDYPAKRNAIGFSALPGGGRFSGGSFSSTGSQGTWWGATGFSSTIAVTRYLYYFSSDLVRWSFSKDHGFSVRCLRD